MNMTLDSTQSKTDQPVAYLRLKGAARFLDCSPQYIMKLHREGMGPRKIKIGRASFYPVADLVAFMEQGRTA